MRWCVSETAAADCVLLGVNINEVQRSVRRRGVSKVRLSGGERLKVTTFRRVITRVQSAVVATPEAKRNAEALGLDAASMLKLLAQPKPRDNIYRRPDGVQVTVASIGGADVVVAACRRLAF